MKHDRHQREPAFDLPSQDELVAYRLRKRGGLSDSEIADLLGVARETVNRRIARASRKVQTIRQSMPGDLERFDSMLGTGSRSID